MTTNTPASEVPSLQDELRGLKLDNGLLKLSNEQLAHNYKLADQCAHEREIQILALLRERGELTEMLDEVLTLTETFKARIGYQGTFPLMTKAHALLSRIRSVK